MHSYLEASGSALFAKIKTIFSDMIHHNLEIMTCDPLNHKMEFRFPRLTIYIVSLCMG